MTSGSTTPSRPSGTAPQKAIYFFQNPQFGQDLRIGGLDLAPYCVPAGARSASIGIYNDRLSSAIVSRVAGCQLAH